MPISLAAPARVLETEKMPLPPDDDEDEDDEAAGATRPFTRLHSFTVRATATALAPRQT
mgnify:CR=1 FL=1